MNTTLLRRILPALVLLSGTLLFFPAGKAPQADEGMWTLDNFPRKLVRDRHNVEIDDAWLERVRLATTRLEGGCTGSFVSPDGLVLTNHHCARRCISRLSSSERNLEETGFLAAERSDEESCPAEQISVLVGVEEITNTITEATTGKDERQANDVRRQTLTRMEKACEDAAGKEANIACESVSLYNGGQYFMYTYRRYDDIRLVFAPESAIAAFGGDPDNFNFPRYCLDMAFLRAYEDGRPARTPHYLRWRPEGAVEGEPVFVSGHPGSTERLLTVAELRFLRDHSLPQWLLRFSELRGRLAQFGKTGDEPHRIVQSPLLGIENGIKVRRNELAALFDDELMARKMGEEQALRATLASNTAMNEAYGSAWNDMERALRTYLTFRDQHLFIERGAAFGGSLFRYARALVRASAERLKPNEERLRAYTESALPQLRQRVLAPRPVYPDLEELNLSFSLEKMREWLGPDDPMVKQILGNDSPDTLASKLVSESQLDDAAFRRALWEGGQEAIDASDDPMIRLALAIDPEARALRQRHEDEVKAVQDAASEKIARARFALEGTSNYPDATFTLRVTFGTVEGWEEKGARVSPFTTIGVAFDRATGQDPFRLPQSWPDARPRLHLNKRFNFVATTDITGGNSGSPVIDKDGNLVGLAFDGNIHSIAGSYWFDATKNRTVAVHPAAMLEALRVVYRADALLGELTGSAVRTAEKPVPAGR